jgi:hypothetical protein
VQGQPKQSGPQSGKPGKPGGPISRDDKQAQALAEFMPEASQREQRTAAATPLAQVTAINDPKVTLQRLVARSGRSSVDGATTAANAVDIRQLADSARRGLQSVERITMDRRLQTGRMDRRAITRASIGAQDVFSRRTVAPGMKTAVLLMIDGSSSMCDSVDFRAAHGGIVRTSRYNAVVGMACAILPALDRARAESAAAVFSGGGLMSYNSYVMQNATVGLVKAFGQRVPQETLLNTWGATGPSGGTPMMLETKWVRSQLLPRKVERRVCLWLIDGQPDGGPMTIRAEMDRQRAKGIEHYGIGLDVSLTGLFDPTQCISVNDMSRLPRAIEDLLLGRAK